MLTVPGCPNGPALEERLARALADRENVSVLRRIVDDVAQATRLGMHGSPTLLIDGRDPFAVPGLRPGISCRMYRAEDGRLEGAPSLNALREALADPANRA